eukprot:2395923-Pyramimonas_sp.AAC.1
MRQRSRYHPPQTMTPHAQLTLTHPPSAVPAGQRKGVGTHGGDGGGRGSRGVPPSEQSVRQQSPGSATRPAGRPRSN